jgi:hypothetical protein
VNDQQHGGEVNLSAVVSIEYAAEQCVDDCRRMNRFHLMQGIRQSPWKSSRSSARTSTPMRSSVLTRGRGKAQNGDGSFARSL